MSLRLSLLQGNFPLVKDGPQCFRCSDRYPGKSESREVPSGAGRGVEAGAAVRFVLRVVLAFSRGLEMLGEGCGSGEECSGG